MLEEDREVRFRDVPQEDLGCARYLLPHPDLPDPRPDRPGPGVLLLAGDAATSRQPPWQRLPCHSRCVPARPEGDRALSLPAGSFLDDPDHAGADPSALAVPRNIDVDQ